MQIGCSDEIGREGNIGKVFDVLMLRERLLDRKMCRTVGVTDEVVDQHCELMLLSRELGLRVVVFRSLWYGKLFFIHPCATASASICTIRALYAHILTSSSNISGCSFVHSAQILAMADPQLPEPTMVTLCFLAYCPRVAMTAEEADRAVERTGDLKESREANDLEREGNRRSAVAEDEAKATNLSSVIGCFRTDNEA